MAEQYDIYRLAAQNQKVLSNTYKLCCKQLDSALLDDFIKHLKDRGEVTVAINSGFAFKNTETGQWICTGRSSRELVLSDVLRAGKYMNAYERYQTQEEQQQHFSKFKNERTVFDSTFIKGQVFKYFNLNDGQLGIPAFGDFTLAFPLTYFSPEALVFLKYNSLIRKSKTEKVQCYYFTENNQEVSIARLSGDLATVRNFTELLVVKFRDELRKPPVDFNHLVLRPFQEGSPHRDYVEVIVWEEVPIAQGASLRVERGRFDALVDAFSDPEQSVGAELRSIAELQALINQSEQEKGLNIAFV